jgi:hypothetical protein
MLAVSGIFMMGGAFTVGEPQFPAGIETHLHIVYITALNLGPESILIPDMGKGKNSIVKIVVIAVPISLAPGTTLPDFILVNL